MTYGANRSGARKRVQVRTPSGKSVLRFREKRPGQATCVTGRPLPGTARGTQSQIHKLTKTQRRPSRPYGGVLSSPALRELMRERVEEQFTAPDSASEQLFVVGTVCMKIAGRDAGKLCAVTELIDVNFVKVDGYTRPRKVNYKHLQPVGKTISIKSGATSKDIQALIAE